MIDYDDVAEDFRLTCARAMRDLHESIDEHTAALRRVPSARDGIYLAELVLATTRIPRPDRRGMGGHRARGWPVAIPRAGRARRSHRGLSSSPSLAVASSSW